MTRILCIEDDEPMAHLVEMIVARMGHEVKSAQSGHDGLSLVDSFKPDIVLLDLMMPDMDGWDIYQHLKAHEETRHIPVIVVTARSLSADKEVAMKLAQVEEYITKPFTPQYLGETIVRVLDQSTAR
ncbi:MAG: response regulator [Anaerolineae bacterium]|nr:response regulator [Anaerolineae bacterium]